MTPNLVLVNGLQTTLAGNLSPSATTIIVASSSGIPAITAGQILPLTIISAASQSTFEIVYATAISGTTLTVTRAQEGTQAGTFSIGDYVECSPTAQTVGISGIQTLQVSTNSTITPSFARTVVLTPNLTANITVTIATGNILGQKVIVYGSPASYTVNIASSVSSGSPYFAFVDGSKGYTWGLAPTFSGAYIELTWDGTNWSAETAGYRITSPAGSGNQAVSLAQGQSVFAAKNGNAANLFSAAPAVSGNQVTSWTQTTTDGNALTSPDCNTIVKSGQYLLVTPTNWANTYTSSGILSVSRVNNEILQITCGFNNGLLFWRSSQYVTDAGFPAGTPWNTVLSSNNTFATVNTYSINTGQQPPYARQPSVVYTNTTGKPMIVFATFNMQNFTSGQVNGWVGGNQVFLWVYSGGTSNIYAGGVTVPLMVPAGATYEVTGSTVINPGNATLMWTETY